MFRPLGGLTKAAPLYVHHVQTWCWPWCSFLLTFAILTPNQSLKKDVTAAQPEMQKLSKDLETTEKLCSSLQQGYQEYCPDIRRQEAKVKDLQIRYANISNQLTERYVDYCRIILWEGLETGPKWKYSEFLVIKKWQLICFSVERVFCKGLPPEIRTSRMLASR